MGRVRQYLCILAETEGVWPKNVGSYGLHCMAKDDQTTPPSNIHVCSWWRGDDEDYWYVQ